MSTSITIPIYDSSIPLLPVSGNTPFGYYDNDPIFQVDAEKFVVFASRRLGYPIVEIQLQDINFYAALEDAITVYGKEIYEYKIRENYLSLEGNSTSSAFNNTLIQPNLGNLLRIAEDYGSEAGSGGNVPYYSGSLQMTAGTQTYDLNYWASASGIVQNGDSIEIKRIFYESPPAIVRYFDPYAGTGTGLMSLMETFGFGQFSPGVSFMLMPIYFDVLKIQAIEFNDQIRKSGFSFEIQNNKLRIFPIPNYNANLYFTYIKKSERNSVIRDPRTGLVTNISNVPFNVPSYSQLNSVFRKWIYDYALAIVKEILGNIRSNYSSIPIPGAEITMNGPALIEQARAEQEALITQLRDTLNETSRTKQLENRRNESESLKETLANIPMPIYIF